ncbi:site-specific DNA-methyltransferase [Kordiimonas aquimaris]|uniref:site-specific DNA-methyltransferase n=1 Tax=Kordiimonas aquimaris TaxID=707591 RepID=UPI0021D257E6|nr:DNA methyltransferase [Kordiimonas aquimaris]
MTQLNSHIEYIEPKNLNPYKKGLRKQPKNKIDMLAKSIDGFGFVIPIVVDKDGQIVAGHARWLAAKQLGLTKIPIIRVEHLSPAQTRAYRIADNKLAEGGKWDLDVLRVELSEIMLEIPDVKVEAIGFEQPEFEILMDGDKKKGPTEPDLVERNDDFAVTEPGGMWQLGKHFLYCGDARNSGSFEKPLQGDKAHIVFADPPYNVPVNNFVCGKGAIKHREFACAAGEMSEEEFTTFLKLIFQNMIAYSTDGSVHYICMDWRHLNEILGAAGATYSQLLNMIVWNKTNSGMGSLYRSKHELIFAYKNGKAGHINNVQLGKHGRNRTNVWDYAGVNSINSEHRDDLALHPTVKPTALIADALKDCSHQGHIVLDPFGGSGSTLLAAEQTGRCARLIEIDPVYCDVTIRRWQAMTGKSAVNTATGMSFDDHAAISECSWRLSNVA